MWQAKHLLSKELQTEHICITLVPSHSPPELNYFPPAHYYLWFRLQHGVSPVSSAACPVSSALSCEEHWIKHLFLQYLQLL